MNTVSAVLRIAVLLLCSLLAVLFGIVPFALGIAIQACVPRRLPLYVADLVAAAALLAVWLFAGTVPFVITRNDHFSLWQSASVSWLVAVACFHVGDALLRSLWPRRFSSGAAGRRCWSVRPPRSWWQAGVEGAWLARRRHFTGPAAPMRPLVAGLAPARRGTPPPFWPRGSRL